MPVGLYGKCGSNFCIRANLGTGTSEFSASGVGRARQVGKTEVIRGLGFRGEAIPKGEAPSTLGHNSAYAGLTRKLHRLTFVIVSPELT